MPQWRSWGASARWQRAAAMASSNIAHKHAKKKQWNLAPGNLQQAVKQEQIELYKWKSNKSLDGKPATQRFDKELRKKDAHSWDPNKRLRHVREGLATNEKVSMFERLENKAFLCRCHRQQKMKASKHMKETVKNDRKRACILFPRSTRSISSCLIRVWVNWERAQKSSMIRKWSVQSRLTWIQPQIVHVANRQKRMQMNKVHPQKKVAHSKGLTTTTRRQAQHCRRRQKQRQPCIHRTGITQKIRCTKARPQASSKSIQMAKSLIERKEQGLRIRLRERKVHITSNANLSSQTFKGTTGRKTNVHWKNVVTKRSPQAATTRSSEKMDDAFQKALIRATCHTVNQTAHRIPYATSRQQAQEVGNEEELKKRGKRTRRQRHKRSTTRRDINAKAKWNLKWRQATKHVRKPHDRILM